MRAISEGQKKSTRLVDLRFIYLAELLSNVTHKGGITSIINPLHLDGTEI